MGLDVKGKAVKKEETVKAGAAAVAATDVKEYADGVLESKSGTIAFVAALGDPSQDDTTTKVENGKEVKIVDPTIVGYRFKALEDIEVPEIGTTDAFSINKSMDYNEANINKTKKVKKGETFDLTKFETGVLLSPPEFNGKVTGGQLPVSCVYTMKAKKNAKGELSTVTGAAAVPSISLRASASGTSIKDVDMIPVLTFTKEKTEAGTVRKNRAIIKGFEKWLPLTVAKQRVSKAGGAFTPKTARNKGAEAFLSILNKKA